MEVMLEVARYCSGRCCCANSSSPGKNSSNSEPTKSSSIGSPDNAIFVGNAPESREVSRKEKSPRSSWCEGASSNPEKGHSNMLLAMRGLRAHSDAAHSDAWSVSPLR